MSQENEEAIPSPIQPIEATMAVEETTEPVFDANEFQSQTALPAIKAIYKVFAENVDLIVYDRYAKETTVESINENYAKVAQAMLEVLVEHKVSNRDMQFVIQSFQDHVTTLFASIVSQKNKLEDEFMARSIGARNPGDGHYSKEYATIGDLFVALEKVRTEQKDDEKGYFYVSKKSE